VDGAQECRDIVEFPADIAMASGEGNGRVVWVQGLGECLSGCYDEGVLPSETEVEWAVPGEAVDLARYDAFPMSG
jgi:hypothetical protein